jgi:7,8-dihydro-6-hydroxymethylpterin-pyrophosphokinase
MASKEERDARLDKLEQAVDAWADKRKKRLTKESALLKKILKGRTGSERLNNASVQAASELQVDEISQFLTGE